MDAESSQVRGATTGRVFSCGIGLLAVLLSAAIFGFFYAWVCSTMWGLDAADPRVAIPAMQAMNASVRNVVFAPAFFGTPFALTLTALLARAHGRRRAAWFFLAAAISYAGGALAPTLLVNVPMNEALAAVAVPTDLAAARDLWLDYSGTWQAWNLARTVASGAALLLAVAGVASAVGGRGRG
ncbi:putative membrane protein [Kineosphaera limosa]|uniref:DUF1772 domain-containing protein n=1 Tax=Kineosphaera limosa NBRC 100340 TaxID=1184609 RepID=K6VGY7_9MICO|nr:anthrone oxygenase family protein [Kineosphaera limosa]NYE01369.1 putative membrane protein [Kineosphaera limosa]GAB95458.1 hypothetical protein KILIM_020_00260 [Kineosphaera limosa NBRC 100340]